MSDNLNTPPNLKPFIDKFKEVFTDKTLLPGGDLVKYENYSMIAYVSKIGRVGIGNKDNEVTSDVFEKPSIDCFGIKEKIYSNFFSYSFSDDFIISDDNNVLKNQLQSDKQKINQLFNTIIKINDEKNSDMNANERTEINNRIENITEVDEDIEKNLNPVKGIENLVDASSGISGINNLSLHDTLMIFYIFNEQGLGYGKITKILPLSKPKNILRKEFYVYLNNESKKVLTLNKLNIPLKAEPESLTPIANELTNIVEEETKEKVVEVEPREPNKRAFMDEGLFGTGLIDIIENKNPKKKKQEDNSVLKKTYTLTLPKMNEQGKQDGTKTINVTGNNVINAFDKKMGQRGVRDVAKAVYRQEKQLLTSIAFGDGDDDEKIKRFQEQLNNLVNNRRIGSTSSNNIVNLKGGKKYTQKRRRSKNTKLRKYPRKKTLRKRKTQKKK